MIKRHLTAIRRRPCSKPIRLAMEKKIITKKTTVFDYGCGRGDDIKFLRKCRIKAYGWDPYYFPSYYHHHIPGKKDIVNLGFVLNVIEHKWEREMVLEWAYHMARKGLLVSVRVDKRGGGKKYKDGYITSKNTFQKRYTNGELQKLVKEVLNVAPVFLGPGVCYVEKPQI
jgi:DNA phosphorothioation-associated putative methyltransferase